MGYRCCNYGHCQADFDTREQRDWHEKGCNVLDPPDPPEDQDDQRKAG